ncbi:hypothetical protein FJZ31_34870 [Candidatus Poribacteria bacterium]|nr:hypothetical protein [Candidatus Poribacteria bacterium]
MRTTESPSILVEQEYRGGYFPHISAPQIITRDNDILILFNSDGNTILYSSDKQLKLGLVEGARLAVDSDGNIYIAGGKKDELYCLRVDSNLASYSAIWAAKLTKRHPAVGLDIEWTEEGVVIAAPEVERRALVLYYPEKNHKRLIVERVLAHPLLSYDRSTKRLHLVFCDWNDYSAFYDVIYYTQSNDYGATWTKAAGASLPLPFECGKDGVAPDILSGRWQNVGAEANTFPHCLTLDSRGNPHILYSFCRPYFIAVGPATAGVIEPFMRTKHVCWNGDEWIMSELSADFSRDVAGGSLIVDDSPKFYALVMFKNPNAQWLDLGYTSSQDNGKTWKPITAITPDANSRETHYVAPSAVSLNSLVHYVYTDIGKSPGARIYYHRTK